MYFWETPAPAFASATHESWVVWVGSGFANQPTITGWRIAHENSHVVGGEHSDTGCNLMKYQNCDGSGSACDLAFEDCDTNGPGWFDTLQGLSQTQCNELLNDSHTTTRCAWNDDRLDCNNDDSVNVSDSTCFADEVTDAVLAGEDPKELDCNLDTSVNVSDSTCWADAVTDHILASCP